MSRKITRAVARMQLGLQQKLYLGNLDAKRDWGHAKDFVRAMWLMLQQKKPDDYVIATGESHSVREFVELAFREIGVGIQWKGKGVKEKGIISKIRDQKPEVGGQRAEGRGQEAESRGQDKLLRVGDVVVEVDPRYFRPTEVDELLGDASKARKELGWNPEMSFQEMVSSMVQSDLEEALKDQYCKDKGFRVLDFNE